MTRDDRPTSRDREPTNPDGIAARKSDAPAPNSGAADSSRPIDSSRKAFNPWRFGFHTVSPDHRRELLEMQLPETPAERLFDPSVLDPKAEASGSAPPPLTVDASEEKSAVSDSGRNSDTLRLRRGPPLVHPLRLATPWAVGAAVVVIALLWLVTGKSEPQNSATAKSPPTSATPDTATPAAAIIAIPDEAASDIAKQESPAPSATASVAPKRAEGGKATQAATAPAAVPATPPSAVVQQPPAKKPVTPDDASPFGTWTAPPRD